MILAIYIPNICAYYHAPILGKLVTKLNQQQHQLTQVLKKSYSNSNNLENVSKYIKV